LAALVIPPRIAAQNDRDGKHAKFITFDAPGAGTGEGQGTSPVSIIARGAIMGFYLDASNVSHGFLRACDGRFTTFEAPGAATGVSQGTFTASFSCLNPAGAIIGAYVDASNVLHGFVRDLCGKITEFDASVDGTGPGFQAGE
jgi:hypothetical protein